MSVAILNSSMVPNSTGHIYPSVRELSEYMDWEMLVHATAPYYNEQQLKSLAESGNFIIQVHFRSKEGKVEKNLVEVGPHQWYFQSLESKVSLGSKVLTPFIVSVDHTIECETVAKKFAVHTLAATLAEAAANYLTSRIAPSSIRPAFGYPMCPIHSYKKDVLDFLHVNEFYKLTSTFGIIPETSICGVIIPK